MDMTWLYFELGYQNVQFLLNLSVRVHLPMPNNGMWDRALRGDM